MSPWVRVVSMVCLGSSTIAVAKLVTPRTSLKDIFSAMDSGFGESMAKADADTRGTSSREMIKTALFMGGTLLFNSRKLQLFEAGIQFNPCSTISLQWQAAEGGLTCAAGNK